VAVIAPFGQWDSPLQAADVAAGKTSLSELLSDGSALYWLEARPSEGGRVVLVHWRDDVATDHSPTGASLRSRVHEYGGGAVCLVPGRQAGGFAYVELTDQRVWCCDGAGAAPRALTADPPDGESWHHGGLTASADGQWVLVVREVHRADDPQAVPRRSVLALATDRAEPFECELAAGHDFYGTPRLDGPGGRLVTVAWDHPDMPWDAGRVVVVLVRGEGEGETRRLVAGEAWEAGGGPAESVGQPAWRPDGTLRFVSDRAGWWQPYSHPGQPGETPVILCTAEAEFHGPDWVLSQSTMADLPDGRLVARMTSNGLDAVVLLDPTRPDAAAAIAQPCVAIADVCLHGDAIAVIGATVDAPTAVWLIPLDPGGPPARIVSTRSPALLGPRDTSPPEPFTVTGRSGRPIHGVLYHPALDAVAGPPGSRPPLVVWCHGGPTSAARAGFDLTLLYFTTRGFAVATVDYAGSTGYGRAVRCGLWGLWGVADAEDCLDAALALAQRGQVDGQRMAIRGGSAGGLTALNAVAAGEGFAACVSWYGVTDLLSLAATTHDFEARYMDRLVGPLPQATETYEARSPVRQAAHLHGSVLLLQGTEDPVVPPSQAEQLRDALMAAGGHCEVWFFEGEGHGFRRAETLVAALEAELAFYRAQLAL
jgi:dipeptidyl aminopeptidase/acylaminoacyl peptidase